MTDIDMQPTTNTKEEESIEAELKGDKNHE